MKINDTLIRHELHKMLSKKYSENSSRIVNELHIGTGTARADVAVIEKSLIGYEIKSELDTLNRLPNQINEYNRVFDRVYIITGGKHLNKIKELVPDWWGIYEVTIAKNGSLKLVSRQKSKRNWEIDRLALCELLWRDELLDIMQLHNMVKGNKSKTKIELRNKISKAVPKTTLRDLVREKLITRSDWKVDQKHK